MKKLFFYYTHTGNGAVVSEAFKEKGYEIRNITPKKKMPKSTFGIMMKGGFLSAVKHKPKLEPFDSDISGFDEIIIGSPIWNGRFAYPTNTLIKSLDLKDKKVTFILYSASGEAKAAVKRIQKEFPKSAYIILKEPKKNKEELEKLKDL